MNTRCGIGEEWNSDGDDVLFSRQSIYIILNPRRWMKYKLEEEAHDPQLKMEKYVDASSVAPIPKI